ncbi:hypothetical protein LR48_Vigan468s010000 [Vigna angularis]|uniref:Uncharacterized protein n=1 Tax=Phaseolus angularis TaxID=3914 RepID=A0A0L9TBL4_PHAAN|nr:hypothetical protein LR48_Vigan468s010000 [Vigna angularis]
MQSDSLSEKVLVLTEEVGEEEEEDCARWWRKKWTEAEEKWTDGEEKWWRKRRFWFPMIPPRQKKWTEAEGKTLIDKYGEMVADGSLAKMRTREKKFKDGDFGTAMDGVDNEVMGLGFEYEAEQGEVNYNGNGREREDAAEKGWCKSTKKTLYYLGSGLNRDSRVHNTSSVHNRGKKK